MADDFNLYESDNEVNDAVHSNLVAAVTQLEGKQRVKASIRKEPSTEVSEFHLVNSGTGKKGEVHLHELAQVLGIRSSHSEISQKIKALNRHGKKLPKPLEKPEAARIDRVVRYENAKKQLGRWDAVVQANRLSDNLTFPLNQPNIGLEKSSDFLNKFTPQTQLEVEMAKVLSNGTNVESEEAGEESQFPLSLHEMVERRKELAKLRSQQRFREAKAFRQNKIKSKKYHRILKRDKVKQKLKDFETLKISDPEAALKQLEELDRARVEERASLRHRSTGHWAKNKAVRAKYDVESRKALAQQLSISRDLTQKVRKENTSDEEDNDEETPSNTVNSSDNPWVGPLKTSAEVSDFVHGYRKYYEQQAARGLEEKAKEEGGTETIDVPNGVIQQDEILAPSKKVQKGLRVDSKQESQATSNAEKSPFKKLMISKDNSGSKKAKKSQKHVDRLEKDTKKSDQGQAVNSSANKEVRKKQEKKKTKNSMQQTDISSDADNLSGNNKQSTPHQNKTKKTKNAVEIVSSSAGKWNVTPVDGTSSKSRNRKNAKRFAEDIDGLFENIDQQFRSNVDKKLKKMKSNMHIVDGNFTVGETTSTEPDSDYLAFKKPALRPIIDEQLNEGPNYQPTINKHIASASLAQSSYSLASGRDELLQGGDIDPNKFMAIKPTHLKTQLPDIITAGDEAIDDDAEKQLTIMEAFADDDVVAEFRKEKEVAVKGDAPEDVSLAMPGWGSWAGQNIRKPGRKKRRFMVRKPVGPPRKDTPFGDVIISEVKDKKMREHLVNALPFPFTSVKSYEASIRAPIGNTWIPETSFRKLIAPRIKTKLGAIIEPMNEQILVNKNVPTSDIKWK